MSKYVIYLNSASYQFYIDYDNDAKHFVVNGSFGFNSGGNCTERIFGSAEEIKDFVSEFIATWCILTIANKEPGQEPTETTWDWTQVFKTLDVVAGDKGTTFVHCINLLVYHAETRGSFAERQALER